MHSTALASRQFLARRIVGCLPILALSGATIVSGCHDAPSGPPGPRSPTLAVSTDGAWLVNSLADPGDGVCSNSECTLREAIAAAQDGDRITFKSNLTGTIALTAGVLDIDKSLTIDGLGPRVLTVDGQNTSTVFDIGLQNPVIVTVTGLTVSRGKTAGDGGGIFVRKQSRLVLIGSVVSGSSAASGGGIYNAGSLTLAGSTVAGNTSVFRGAGIYSDGDVTLSRSTISNNRSEGPGGGIYGFCGTIVCGVTLTLRSSTVTANVAGTNGGGVVLVDIDGITSNTIIAGNSVNGDAEFHNADCEVSVATFESLGHTLTSAKCEGLTNSPTDVIAAVPQVFSSVLLRLLADNGGGLPTHALIERGLAVDAGYCPGENGDQRGFPRPYDDPLMPNALDGCDIGAFEWNPPPKNKGSKP